MTGGKPTLVIPVTSSFDFEAKKICVEPETLLVLYFHAPWAAPCAQMSTVLQTLAATYPVKEPPTVSFLSINAEEFPDASEAHDVSAVPFIVLMKDEKTLETISGGDAAKVRAAVEKYAGSGSGSASGPPTTQLPPQQQVTRPEQQPVAAAAGVLNAAVPSSNAGADGGTSAKNLSAYAPGSADPKTGPEYSSNSTRGLDDTPTDSKEAPKQDLHTRLTELTNAAPVMLFMKGTPSAPQCGFSRQLVSILRENSVRYGFFNILADEEVRQGMKEFADWPTFPQLWMSGDLVGGLDIVKEEMETNPDFFTEYSVAPGKRNEGGPAAADEQARPTATA